MGHTCAEGSTVRRIVTLGLSVILLGLAACTDATGGASDPTEAASTESSTDETTPAGELSGPVSVFELPVGACIRDSGVRGNADEINLVPCDGPHRAEIYASTELNGADYPTDADAQAEQFCYDEFATFIGVPLENSRYDYAFLYPTEESWTELEDRTVTCIATAPEDQTATLKDARE